MTTEDLKNGTRGIVTPERGKGWSTVEIDEENLPVQTSAFRGLMDAELVSAYLGYPRGTIRSWESRRKTGSAKSAAPDKFPQPLEHNLSSGSLWDEADIVAFRKQRALKAKAKKEHVS